MGIDIGEMFTADARNIDMTDSDVRQLVQNLPMIAGNRGWLAYEFKNKKYMVRYVKQGDDTTLQSIIVPTLLREYKLTNATPLTLDVWRGPVPAANGPALELSRSDQWLRPDQLPPRGTLPLKAASENRIHLTDQRSGITVSTFELGGDVPDITITPPDLVPEVPSRGPAYQADIPRAKVTVRNRTPIYIDVSHQDGERAFTRACPQPIAPGEDRVIGTRSVGALIFRSTFTGELAGLVVVNAPSGEGEVTVDGRWLQERTRSRPQPLVPIPGGRELKLIMGQGVRPALDSPDYTTITAYDYGTRSAFNGEDNVKTRLVRCAAVKLVLDETGALSNYLGMKGKDIEKVEIFADQVVVETLARFPGADVTITARVLEFVDRADRTSSIDTTPISRGTTAFSSKTADGFPANLNGTPRYVGESGVDGEHGGSITLNIRDLVVPKGSAKRFVAKGGAGQAAEAGGHKPYAATSKEQPNGGKDLSSVNEPKITEKMITDKLKEKMPIATRPSDWRWPGGKHSPGEVQWKDGSLLSQNLVHLRLIAVDPNPFSVDVHCLFFPSGESEWFSAFNKDLLEDRLPEKKSNTRPGDGEDAYPSGTPGKGGDGGNIASTLHPCIENSAVPPPDRFGPLCDVTAGQPGPATDKKSGKRPGSPNPAYRASMMIVKDTSIPLLTLKPELSVEDVTAKSGEDAEAKEGGIGREGSITGTGTGTAMVSSSGAIRLPTGHAKAWADPIAVDAVLACAKDAYRNGFRTDARHLLEPYFCELSCVPDLGPDLSSRLTTIAALRQNVIDDLDFFGHPPGWVPRLGAQTNFALYREFRKSATELLLFARARLAAYDQRDVARVKTEDISAKLWGEIETRRKLVEEAMGDLTQARADIGELAKEVAAVQVDIGNLIDWVTDHARDKVKAQRVFKGVMKLVGGAMKVVPYGQPYLGMGGDVLAGIGEFNWNKTDAAAQWAPILEGLGKKADKFLENNKDLIAADIAGPPPDTTVADRALADRLEAARRELKKVEQGQAEAAENFKKKWTEGKATYLAAKKARLAEWEKELTPITTDPSQLNSSLTYPTYAAIQAELGAVEAADFVNTGLALKASVARLEASIARANAADKKRLEVEKKELAKFKAKIDALEEEKKAAETTAARGKEDHTKAVGEVKEGLDRLKGIGDGIGQIGAGIASLASPVAPGDPEVKAIVNDILDLSQEIETPNEKRETYRTLLKNLAEIESKQQKAVRALLGAQQAIATNTAAIAQGLSAASDLAHRSQLLSAVQDIRVKRHLSDMQTRARDLMQWALYHFVMAFRYEFLMDVPSDIFNIDNLIDAIVRDATVDANGNPIKDASGNPVTFETVSAEAYAKSEEKILKDYLLRIAQKLVARRQSKNAPAARWISSPFPLLSAVPAPAAQPKESPPVRPATGLTVDSTASVDIAPSPSPTSGVDATPMGDALRQWVHKTRVWLDTLRRNRIIWLHPVDDLRMVNGYTQRGARIRAVTLKNITLEVPSDWPRFEFNLRFVHSGVSIIYDTSERGPGFDYFYFTKGPSDDPISWNFRCAWSATGKKVEPSPDSAAEDSMIAALMKTDKLELKPYQPALFSPLAIVLDYTASDGAETFPKIQSLEFAIQIEHTGDPS
ncbi:MAG TPA: hypothetical protein VMS64_11565 [Candidatus Methylomirabilis sp.]|nr:hypothetical protein [Candidatus Methylomirabilis sp.]